MSLPSCRLLCWRAAAACSAKVGMGIRPVRRFASVKEDLQPASEGDTGKYANVIKVGDKLYGVPLVKSGALPQDLQQQTGRRFEEVVYELNGDILFNRDPIYALADQGTKENPILVPSGLDERVVGFEDPLAHQLSWFKLREGDLAYVPQIGKYFRLQKV